MTVSPIVASAARAATSVVPTGNSTSTVPGALPAMTFTSRETDVSGAEDLSGVGAVGIGSAATAGSLGVTAGVIGTPRNIGTPMTYVIRSATTNDRPKGGRGVRTA